MCLQYFETPTGIHGNKKVPEAITASGTNKNPWYHPDYFLIIKEVTSDSSKSYPVTGETVFHYLLSCSQNQLRNQTVRFSPTGSHQPPALCKVSKRQIFRQRLYPYNEVI